MALWASDKSLICHWKANHQMDGPVKELRTGPALLLYRIENNQRGG